MDETETEIQTIERLEAALARIAAHAGPKGAGPDREAMARALDRVIAQLRQALAEADRADTEQG